MEASSAGGEIWDAVRRSLKRPLLCSQIWDDRLADTHTDTRTRKKMGPPAKTYRVARALFSRGRLMLNLRGFPPGVPTGVGKNRRYRTSLGPSPSASVAKTAQTSVGRKDYLSCYD
jgi:hypothetical protein